MLRSPQPRSVAATPGRRAHFLPRATRALAVALALAAFPAAAAVYKWVDANGRVVYSDQPPPPSITKSETLGPVPPPANPNAAKELQDKESARQQADKKRADDAATAGKALQDTERRREACATARGQLTLLLDANQPMVRVNEKGERVVMDDSARRLEIDRAQQLIRETCRP